MIQENEMKYQNISSQQKVMFQKAIVNQNTNIIMKNA